VGGWALRGAIAERPVAMDEMALFQHRSKFLCTYVFIESEHGSPDLLCVIDHDPDEVRTFRYAESGESSVPEFSAEYIQRLVQQLRERLKPSLSQ
jgi:hypothetical protein